MPASNRRNTKSYHTPGVVNGNLAHDVRRREWEPEHSGHLDFEEHYQHRQQQESQADKQARQRQQRRAAVRQAQPIPLAAVLCCGVIACLAVLVIACHVKVNAISNDIVAMKRQIEVLEQEQVALRTHYEQAFDLTGVEENAEATGMTQPSEGQVFYINLPGQDQTVVYQQTGDGVLGRTFHTVVQYIRSVLEYFR